MRVSFLVPDIFNPVLGPVTDLARHAATFADVQVVGPDFGHGVCPMYRGHYPYTVVPSPRLYRFPEYFVESRRLAAAVTGDIVVAVKAFASTVPVAWWLRRQRGIKMVVYLDEWDGALMAQRSRSARISRWLRNIHHPMDDVYCPWIERLIPGADLVLSTSTALQRRFGGEVLPVGVDTDFFSPRPAEETASLRSQLGLTGCRVVVFGGVVRPHKGVEQILAALAGLGRPDVRLLIVGPENEHVKALLADARFRPLLVCTGARPKAEMPGYLDVGDVIALPFEDTPLARTQTPCKIFEAMSMAKPIVATAVSDLPLILEGCGRVVPPGDAFALADALGDMLQNPSARMLGERARARCKEQYAAAVTARRLRALCGQVLGGGRTVQQDNHVRT
jgi:glycosyltransferase involved in cell wall biosynthesis